MALLMSVTIVAFSENFIGTLPLVGFFSGFPESEMRVPRCTRSSGRFALLSKGVTLQSAVLAAPHLGFRFFEGNLKAHQTNFVIPNR